MTLGWQWTEIKNKKSKWRLGIKEEGKTNPCSFPPPVQGQVVRSGVHSPLVRAAALGMRVGEMLTGDRGAVANLSWSLVFRGTKDLLVKLGGPFN